MSLRSRSARERRADRALMFDFLRGDPEAFEQLYRRFAPEIFGIGLRAFEDPDRAAELLTGTFVKLRRRGSSYLSGSVPLDAWAVAQALGVALLMSRVRDPDREGSLDLSAIDADLVPA